MIGMHFFNPAHVMKLVEIIPGAETDQDTIDTVEQFTQELRKIPVIVQECPGFLVNRLLMPYLNEAVLALEQGAATAQEIDEAMGRDGFGWPMGPFFLMDMLGIDVCAHVGEYLYSHYGERVAAGQAVRQAGRRRSPWRKIGRGLLHLRRHRCRAAGGDHPAHAGQPARSRPARASAWTG